MWDGMVLGCRFLRARKFDVPKAKAMLLSAEQWRKDEKVDELAQCVIVAVRAWSFAKPDYLFSRHRTFEFTEKKEVDKYYPQYYHKIDKVKKNQSWNKPSQARAHYLSLWF